MPERLGGAREVTRVRGSYGSAGLPPEDYDSLNDVCQARDKLDELTVEGNRYPRLSHPCPRKS